jgi:cytochrome P450
MNVHQPPLFRPPRPEIPTEDLGWYQFFAAVRTNALKIWPRAAYEEDVLVASLFGRQRFLLNAPKAIHRVFVDNTSNYVRTPATIRILRPIVGDGLFLSEGEEWRHQRRTIAPALAPRVMPMLARHVASATQETIARLGARADEPLDLLATIQFLTLEIAARSMFSLEMHKYGAALRAMIARFAANLGRPFFFDLMLPTSVPTLRDFARMRFRKRWIALMDEVIAARLRAEPSDKPRDLFDMLLAARDPETGVAFSRAQLRDQMATMIVAGHETTALALFWSMYLLASAAGEQTRLAEDVANLTLTPETAGETLPKLSLARAVVDEALRLYPPAFAMARKAVGEDEVEGARIRPGALVMVSPWVLHRHLRLWNEPDAFDPSRFLNAKPLAHRFAYLPFGTGPRACVGAQFALTEASLVLAMLIQNFRVTLADSRPVLPMAVITTQPDHPAPFHLVRR